MFDKFSFHHKWNEAFLLVINMVCTSCFTCCRTTQDLRYKAKESTTLSHLTWNPEPVPNTLSTTAIPDPTGTYPPTHTDRTPFQYTTKSYWTRRMALIIFFFFFFVLYRNDAWMTAKVIDSPWNLVISDNEISIITMISTCCQVCYKYDKKIVKYFCCNLISWNYFFWN